MNIIKRNKFIYQLFKEDIFHCLNEKEVSEEIVLQKIAFTANFAVHNYTGFIVDSDLDRVLTELPLQDNILQPQLKEFVNKPKILHIATHLYSVGGHSRVILNWVENDIQNDHYLFLTQQESNNEILDYIGEKCRDFRVINKGESLSNTGKELFSYIHQTNPKWIILHHHPNDPVPLHVISKIDSLSVLFFNHADNIFSIGRTYKQKLINFSITIDSYLRNYIPELDSFILPLPVFPIKNTQQQDITSQGEDIYQKERLLVAMGTSYKFKSFGDLDFFKIWAEILEQTPDYRLLIIGVSPKEIELLTSTKIHSRITPIGNVITPKELLNAAEYFIEPFPLGSALGTLEAIFWGATPIFNYYCASIYGEGTRIVFPPDVREKLPSYSTKNEYVEWVINELKEREFKNQVFPNLQSYVRQNHSLNWSIYLKQLYEGTSNNINRKNKIHNTNNSKSNYSRDEVMWVNLKKKTTLIKAILNLNYISIKNKPKLVYFFFLEAWQRKKITGLRSIFKLLLNFNSFF